MAPTRPKNKKNNKKPKPLGALLQDAILKLQEGRPDKAAQTALRVLEETGEGGDFELAALNLLGPIHIELGEIDAARNYLVRAAQIDTDGSMEDKVGGGPEKFLWLAQLSEDGGRDSVTWYEKGAVALRRQIQSLEEKIKRRGGEDDEEDTTLHEKRRELAGALCAVAEVYMTDLSWEPDAEQRCEALITEATLACPESAETWQTVANVRISQSRTEEARTALTRSIDLWKDLPLGDFNVPEFPIRVSLARLLMEVEMERAAFMVLERLVLEDDESVEVWYLGGWCLYILGEKERDGKIEPLPAPVKDDGEDDVAGWKGTWTTARLWFTQCLKLFAAQRYEDERLGAHARELSAEISKVLGPLEEEEEEEGWEDASGGEDEEDDDEDEDEEDEEMKD